MSGIYGSVKPASINISNDVSIYYNYKETRSNYTSSGFYELNNNILTNAYIGGDTSNPIPGMYNLNLPLSTFGTKGIYTVYIKPKEIDITIKDTGVLALYTDVRGVVFSASDLTKYKSSNALAGYRIEFVNSASDVKTRTELLILSSSLCTPSDKSGTVSTYSYSDTGEMIFCTVSPSIASTYNSSSIPSIGSSGTQVKLVNTNFDPVMYEIEVVDHDADTISYMLEGDQIRNLDTGLITTYNDNKEIYNQYEYSSLKSTLGEPLYDLKIKKSNVDTTQNYNNIVSN